MFFSRKGSPGKRIPMRSVKNADTLSACVEILQGYGYMDVFGSIIVQIIEQVERFQKKRASIDRILREKFSVEELSYRKFDGVLLDVEKVVYLNLRSIVNRIAVFDYEEFKQLDNLEWNDHDLAAEKMGIYGSYISFVQEASRDNEEIVLKLDRLLLEVTHYNSLHDGNILDMPAIAELDQLIRNAKRYR